MTHEEHVRRAVERQLAAFNAHDLDALLACFHPDVEVVDLPTGARNWRGHAMLRTSFGDMFAQSPRLRAEVTSRQIVGRFAFDYELVSGRAKEAVRMMAIYEVDDDGLIVRVWFVNP